MIVLTKEENKATFESVIGEENTIVKYYYAGTFLNEELIHKAKAFDMIQGAMENGWKQGE